MPQDKPIPDDAVRRAFTPRSRRVEVSKLAERELDQQQRLSRGGRGRPAAPSRAQTRNRPRRTCLRLSALTMVIGFRAGILASATGPTNLGVGPPQLTVIGP